MSGPYESPSVLFLISNTLLAERRSGIHRVTIELAKSLTMYCSIDYVKWDEQDGQLRFADVDDLNCIFRDGDWPAGLKVRSTAHKVRYRFGDLLDPKSVYWLLNSEIAYHGANGNEILARIISQCREYGVKIATIFYDLIPITNKAYAVYASQHTSYACEIQRSELIFPISNYSSKALEGFYAKAKPSGAGPTLIPILLPELQTDQVTRQQSDVNIRDTVMLVGTVEPRKRQIEFLTAFALARERSVAVAKLKIFVAGSLHPDVATKFHELMANIPEAVYADYAPQELINSRYARAVFSAFPSNDEGYGLPIAESLASGVPCLCANFGSMAEIAQAGGCLTVDVNSIQEMISAIIALAEDTDLRKELRAKIECRSFRTWDDYACEVVSYLTAYHIGYPSITNDHLALADRCAITHQNELLRADKTSATHVSESILKSTESFRSYLTIIAEKEENYAIIKQFYQHLLEQKTHFLRIIISTYNRSDFVYENVSWLLKKVAPAGSGIAVTVVDNASTDSSLLRLREFINYPNFQLISNTSNTGMLGNLKICSTLYDAEYIWVIGDDDFIVPETPQMLINALRENIGIPLGFVNFGIYHRFSLNDTDKAENLIAERIPLAPNAIESGIVSLADVAVQHDNLFTAIYPIIWRSDILASCFNYPFTGKPFRNLVESIPTTKIILESYAKCQVYWVSSIGIVGNAYNSWSHHRPRWHGRLMPDALSLARDAGVDETMLNQWSIVQQNLYNEALEIANYKGWIVDLS